MVKEGDLAHAAFIKRTEFQKRHAAANARAFGLGAYCEHHGTAAVAGGVGEQMHVTAVFIGTGEVVEQVPERPDPQLAISGNFGRSHAVQGPDFIR